ncbi:Aspartyl protease apcb1 [Thalictrum thalictroides]|uniref:Aspartyl protease apcb1 n=1 Tax=Thalictrum thalictroides TaxID=46969 RepID=A0A7J6WRP7_THATH|nr:Aspartyl protease apcb1 [Thalictrum thalictroides]
MEPSQINGVVIITLPPVDNPSKGKTITSIFTISEPNDTSLPTTQQQLQQNQNQNQLHLPPSHRFSFKSFCNTHRRVLGLLSISLLAILFWNSLSSSTTLYELNSSEQDDQEVNPFVFPLYPKVDLGKRVLKDVVKLGKLVERDVVNNVMMLNDGLEHKEIRKIGSLASSSATSADSSTIFPVRGNVYPHGLYYVSILVGNPPKPYHLDMDTGSDLTWIQCDAPCTSCAKGPHSLYKPTKGTGTIVSPKDSLCQELQSNQKHGYCDSCEQCDYEIEYADHSSSMGVLARDELQLLMTNGTMSKPNIVFGCAYDQQGHLSVSPAKTDGILGLNGAKISLPSQLASKGIIRNVVGHCIARIEDHHGYMFLGDEFLPQWGMTWVPMLSSPSIASYRAEIVKLAYGSGFLSLGGLDNNLGRVVFDSGSSYTYFMKEAYSSLVAALKDSFGEELIQDESDPGLPVCWRAKVPIRSLKDVKAFFKPLTLHFGSRWWIISSKLLIPPEGYLIISNKGNVCLGILDGSDVHDESTIILGDISLRGQLVAYDNVNRKIGWKESDCKKPQRYKSLPFFF